MAKGAIAKQEVLEKIAIAFGEDFLGEQDKKIYVLANENGEKIQIAITLTCPKNPVIINNELPQNPAGDWDFSDDGTFTKPTPMARVEITPEEKQKVADLMAKLGL